MPWLERMQGASDLIEVAFAYTRRLDKDYVPRGYCTIFSLFVYKDPDNVDRSSVAKHGLLDYGHGKNPFVPLTREWVRLGITASRGIPKTAYPLQRLSKVQQDALVDRTSITTLPPRLVPPRILQEELGVEFGPAGTIPV